MGAFGDKFRKERERRGFTLDDVANVTKIGSRMLKAIEDEHFDQLPGGVFNRGFIRAYAKHLGLNDDEAVNDYLEALRQAQIDAQGIWEPKPVPGTRAATTEQKAKNVPAKTQVEELPDLHLPRAEDIRPARLFPGRTSAIAIPWWVPAIVVAVMVVGLVLWNRHSRGEGASAARVSAAQSTVDSAPPANASAAPKTPTAGAVTTQTSAAPSHSTAQASAPGGQSSTATSLLSPPPPAAKQIDEPEENDTRATPRSPATPAALTLVIRASENSWISVTADGQTVSQETLIAPAHTSVRATREIVVKAGNAAGVSFQLNGKEIPPQGNKAEVRTFVFDGSGMRVAPPGQAPDPSH